MSKQEQKEEINSLYNKGLELAEQNEFDNAMDILNKASAMANELMLESIAIKISDSVDFIKRKKEAFLKEINDTKKKQDNLTKKQEEAERIAIIKARSKKRKEDARTEKLEALRKEKDRKEQMETVGYDSLGEGSKLVKERKFAEGIVAYQKALTIFEDLKYPTEIHRTKELLSDAEKEQGDYNSKVQKEKSQIIAQKEHQDKITQKIEQSQQEQSEKQAKENELESLQASKSAQDKKYSEEAFSLMDEGNVLAKNQNWDGAIEKFFEANKLFNDISWKGQAYKVLAGFSRFRREKKKHEALVLSEENRKKEEAAYYKDLDQKSKMSHENAAQIKEKEDRTLLEEKFGADFKQNIFDGIIGEIEQFEEIIKNYKNEVGLGNILQTECPYQDGIQIYRSGKKALVDIGWASQAEKLNSGLAKYKELLAKDSKLRELKEKEIITKKKEEADFEKQIEVSHRLKMKKEQERLDLEEKNAAKQREKQDLFNSCLTLLDKGLVERKNHNYDKAVEIYNQVKTNYQSIDYKEGIQVTEEGLIKIENERQEYELHLRKIEQDKADRQKEKEELEQRIAQSQETKEKQQLMDSLKAKEKEDLELKKNQVQSQIIQLLTDAGDLKLCHNYTAAIEKYQEAEKMFVDIDWEVKHQNVVEAIADTNKAKNDYENHLASEKEKREKDEKELIEIQEKIAATKKIREDQRQTELEKASEEHSKIAKEREMESLAWKNMELAEKLAKNDDYYPAFSNAYSAYILFKELGWQKEVLTTQTRFTQMFSQIQNPLFDIKELLYGNMDGWMGI